MVLDRVGIWSQRAMHNLKPQHNQAHLPNHRSLPRWWAQQTAWKCVGIRDKLPKLSEPRLEWLRSLSVSRLGFSSPSRLRPPSWRERGQRSHAAVHRFAYGGHQVQCACTASILLRRGIVVCIPCRFSCFLCGKWKACCFHVGSTARSGSAAQGKGQRASLRASCARLLIHRWSRLSGRWDASGRVVDGLRLPGYEPEAKLLLCAAALCLSHAFVSAVCTGSPSARVLVVSSVSDC
jgi:hypothetical protein